MIIRALIFDMDGLLTDTEPLHMRGYVEVLRRHGLPISEAIYAEHWIQKGLGIREYLQGIESDLRPEDLRAEKTIIYDCLVESELKTMPGALELVQAFSGRLPMAVGSASLRKNVLGALEGTGLARYMDAIISVEDVRAAKPAPDIFLAAAAALRVLPEHCLVLEDAAKGIEAAWRAGMPVLAIPNEWTKEADFSKATAVLPSLTEARVWIEAALNLG